jgi:hypothetical protein
MSRFRFMRRVTSTLAFASALSAAAGSAHEAMPEPLDRKYMVGMWTGVAIDANEGYGRA